MPAKRLAPLMHGAFSAIRRLIRGIIRIRVNSPPATSHNLVHLSMFSAFGEKTAGAPTIMGNPVNRPEACPQKKGAEQWLHADSSRLHFSSFLRTLLLSHSLSNRRRKITPFLREWSAVYNNTFVY